MIEFNIAHNKSHCLCDILHQKIHHLYIRNIITVDVPYYDCKQTNFEGQNGFSLHIIQKLWHSGIYIQFYEH